MKSICAASYDDKRVNMKLADYVLKHRNELLYASYGWDPKFHPLHPQVEILTWWTKFGITHARIGCQLIKDITCRLAQDKHNLHTLALEKLGFALSSTVGGASPNLFDCSNSQPYHRIRSTESWLLHLSPNAAAAWLLASILHSPRDLHSDHAKMWFDFFDVGMTVVHSHCVSATSVKLEGYGICGVPICSRTTYVQSALLCIYALPLVWSDGTAQVLQRLSLTTLKLMMQLQTIYETQSEIQSHKQVVKCPIHHDGDYGWMFWKSVDQKDLGTLLFQLQNILPNCIKSSPSNPITCERVKGSSSVRIYENVDVACFVIDFVLNRMNDKSNHN
eukprot:Filipodium_phascolosomae@DN37_c0_g1_i1.p1